MDNKVIEFIDIDSSPEASQHEDNMPEFGLPNEDRQEQAKKCVMTSGMDGAPKQRHCKYVVPRLSLPDLIYLILRNDNCILTSQIWNYLSGLFPYYECNYSPLIGNTKILYNIFKKPKHFLTRRSIDGSMMKLVVLNPAGAKMQHDIIRAKAVLKRSNLIASIYRSRYLDDFIDGTLDIRNVELYRAKLRPQSFVIPAAVTDENSVNGTSAQQGPPQKRKRKRKLVSKKCVIDLANDVKECAETEVVECAETEVVECAETEVIECEENEVMECAENEDLNPQIMQYLAVDPFGEQLDVESLVALDASNILDSFSSSSNNEEPVNFVNCVWSNNCNSEEFVDVETMSPSTKQPNFPEVDKCIPKWKKIFPWVIWIPEERTIGCTECQSIYRKCSLPGNMAVIVIKNASEIFRVSQRLRQHGEKMSHKLGKILASKQLIAILHFLLSLHFNDFHNTSDILESCKALCDNNAEITHESIYFAFKILGEYLEYRVIQTIQTVNAFSVIADVCSGIVIVRLCIANGDVEEHIIASYMSCLDKSPLDHLTSLGLDNTKVLQYIANARCENCDRCTNLPKSSIKSMSPMRFPGVEKFLLFLWRTTLLTPVHSLCCTVRKLWKCYPHRFRKVTNLQWVQLDKFNYNPAVIISVYENMDIIKDSAKAIYEINGNIDALGLYHSDLKYKNLFVAIFPILSKIIFQLVQFKCSYTLQNDQEMLYKNLDLIRTVHCEWEKKVDSEQYALLSAQMDEVISLISLTAKEFWQPIYLKGRIVPLAFNRLCHLETLDFSSLAKSFDSVFVAIKHLYKYERDDLYNNFCTFAKSHPNIQGLEISNMLELLNNDPKDRDRYKEVYEFLSLLNLLPFSSANVNRCIYEIKVYDSLFLKSSWAGIGANVKPHLLTILSELNNKHRLCDEDMFSWWKEKYLLKV